MSRVAFCALAIGVICAATPVRADTTDVWQPDSVAQVDTARTFRPPPRPLPDSTQNRAFMDSLRASIRAADTTEADTTVPAHVRRFVPYEQLFDSSTNAVDQIRDPVRFPLPAPAHLATVDLAGWLVLQPSVDIDDANGPGEVRYDRRWGLIDRHRWWSDNSGAETDWLRLSFPQMARTDLNAVPVMLYDSVSLGEQLYLRRDTDWPYHARSSYFLRQGDYGETYSQGEFRRLFAPGFGVDLGFGFYENDGATFSNKRDNRHLRLRVVGPLRENLFWDVRFRQFRDKTQPRLPVPYSAAALQRDDLDYLLEGIIYRPTDSTGAHGPWAVGFTQQSGKHDIHMSSSDYHLESHADSYTLRAKRLTYGWLVEGRAALENLHVADAEPSRWGATIAASRAWFFANGTSASLRGALSDWDTDPPAPEIDAAVRFPVQLLALHPALRVQRHRNVPYLFDRIGEPRELMLTASQSSRATYYVERGDPSLPSEWRNEVSLNLFDAGNDSSRAGFGINAHASYVEDYTRWLDVATTPDSAVYTPVAGDVRQAGVRLYWTAPLFWKFVTWVNYGFNYAELLDHERLPEYYPHSASWVLSWIAPKFHYGIDIRLNSAVLYWYGDNRIQVTDYASSPHVVRWDLSAEATMRSFTFHYSVQNLANFPYRTQQGEDFAGRRMRFGIAWHFID